MGSGDEVAYLREQLQLAARLTARLASRREVAEMAQLVVDELHRTFRFYLAAVQRLDGHGHLADVVKDRGVAHVADLCVRERQALRHSSG